MKLYSAADLHSNNHFLSIIDEQDKRILEKRLPNDLAVTLKTLEPYRAELVGVAVESTFNWYWLVDGLAEAGYSVKLVNTSKVRRVIETASTLFRERGIDGTGIADLMNAAGLTHGGFYRQFKSKDDLVIQAVKRAYSSMSDDLRQRLEATTDSPLETLVRHYVSDHHRDDPGHGCSLTALAADAARRDDPALRSFFGSIVSNYIELLTKLVPGRDRKNKRKIAIAILAQMVGSVVLARVVPDRTLSSEIIDTVANDVVKRHPTSTSE